MRFLSVALVGLASVSATAAAEYKTWNEIVGDVPQCIKSCLNDFYTDAGLDDTCGSPSEGTLDCLCDSTSFSSIQDSAQNLSDCIQDECDSSELSEASSKLSDFQDRFSDAEDQCSSSGVFTNTRLIIAVVKKLTRIIIGSSSSSSSSSSDSDSSDDTNSESSSDSPDEKNTASSLVPGFSAFIASGVVLLAGATL